MKFTRDNYEEFVLDFLEGRLSEKEHSDFILFLKNNPDLEQEMNDISHFHLQPEVTIFKGKRMLKRSAGISDFEKDFENYCVADLESDLQHSEKINFENWVSAHPEKRREFEIFRKAYLKADMSIVFSSKSRLKRLTLVQKRIRAFSLFSSIAAVILVIIVLIRPSDILNRKPLSNDNREDEKLSRKNIEVSVNMGGEEQKEKESVNQMIMPREQGVKDGVQDEGKQENIIQNQQGTGNQQPVTSDQQLVDHRESETVNDQPLTGRYRSTNLQDTDTGIRQPAMITPVTPIFAYIENDEYVSFSELKGVSKNPEYNFDSYQTIVEFAGQKILNVLFPQNRSAKKEKTTLWNLASNSIKGLNNLTDEGGYILARETNKDGDPERISFETPLIGFSVPVKNKNSQ